jgi:DNA-binding XRE family transcriptional regulator
MSSTTCYWYYVSVDIASDDEYLIAVPADLGSALRHFRSEAHVSQAEAAALAGVDQPYISRLEHGRFGPALGHALRLLRLVGCEVVVRPTARQPAARG